MRLVCISDTHTYHHQLDVPEGDVLIHAGDFSFNGRRREVWNFLGWFSTQPHPHKIFIAGNHERMFESDPEATAVILKSFEGLHYLQDRAVTIEGLKIYGSPWTPEFNNWAFNVKRGELHDKWAKIPTDVDVLVTHGPPSADLGGVIVHDPSVWGKVDPREVGDEELLEAIMRIKPRVHVCGHIHEGYGRRERDGVTFVNAANVNGEFKLVNPPIVVEL